ncbi:ROK family protein [Candidatus Saccharibacteria bacterium]|nr:ROK family protein [Candidatus Saccharibacteria bacterium]
MSYLSIDIGGTKTLIAVVSEKGRLSRRDKFPTSTDLRTFLNTLFTHLRSYQDVSPSCIIVAVPGIVKNNTPVSLGNRPSWKNIPLYDVINKLFNCDIYFENDASLGAVYESKFYSGKTIYLTFSTGIGGGIAERAKLIKPDTDQFEPGHRLYTFDGQKLEWEDIASCKALEARFNTRATSIRGKSNYQEVAERICLGLKDIIKDERPDTVIIGGPLALRFRHFAKPLKTLLKSELETKKLPRIRPAKSPQEAVTHGIYLYAKGKANG